MPQAPSDSGYDDDELDPPGLGFGDVVQVLRQHWGKLVLPPLAAGLVSVGVTQIIPPTFTARTMILPPQASQGGAAGAALASLGPLAGIASGVAGLSAAGERYVALLTSVTLSDRIVDRFKLVEVYEAKFKVDARKNLLDSVRSTLGKKDGMIAIEVDDHSPQRAADMANAYVEELAAHGGHAAVTEAQQPARFSTASCARAATPRPRPRRRCRPAASMPAR